ncbi:hypothetical protein [Bradyrhizobium sp. BR 10289]|uniref:hypothetical protein n=1 Tax=Bradyrhizobium sp. BR 10289 TaxID=2749993 RepID=UPI001C646D38|nr:hypothetical protein [Bradyrhizobium sp. BR 10289]MBW7974041.1 hypothetical protein [Bradyrhizobium sp. BR 10289]
MTIALLLIFVSALAGLATGFTYRVWALILISPLIALLAAIILHVYGFGIVAGVTTITGCLVASELAYLAATYLMHRREISLQDAIDGAPSEQREQGIRRQHK